MQAMSDRLADPRRDGKRNRFGAQRLGHEVLCTVIAEIHIWPLKALSTEPLIAPRKSAATGRKSTRLKTRESTSVWVMAAVRSTGTGDNDACPSQNLVVRSRVRRASSKVTASAKYPA
jgi:hypothetical protein